MGYAAQRVLSFTKEWNCFVQEVKATGPTYPSISTYRHGGGEYLCSNVRILRDEVWYKIPLIKPLDHCAERNSLERFGSEVYLIIHRYRITGSNDQFGNPVEIKDDDQRPEDERLTEMYCLK